MADSQDNSVIEKKKSSKLKIYSEVKYIPLNVIQSYLIAGSIPAIIFPLVGLATSFTALARSEDYEACRAY